MGLFAKFFGSDEKNMVQREQANFHIIVDRLRKLIQQGVITERDLTYDSVEYNKKSMPKVIVTIDQLFRQGHMKGVEDSIAGFCYLVGMGMGVKDFLKNDKKRN